MSDLNQLIDDLSQNPEFKMEYDALESEYEFIKTMYEERLRQNITQKQLSERTGINQADISRIEKGKRSPKLSTVYKIAKALGLQLQLKLTHSHRGD